MKPAVVAGISYFGAVFVLGFPLGILRTVAVVPRMGETLAVALELPIMLGLAWAICRWLVHRLGVRAVPADGLAMGAVAFGLLMVGEVGVSVLLGGRSLAAHLALYRQMAHVLGLAGQIAFALFPVLQLRRNRRIRPAVLWLLESPPTIPTGRARGSVAAPCSRLAGGVGLPARGAHELQPDAAAVAEARRGGVLLTALAAPHRGLLYGNRGRCAAAPRLTTDGLARWPRSQPIFSSRSARPHRSARSATTMYRSGPPA